MFRNLKFDDGASIRAKSWLHRKCFVSGRFTRRFQWNAFTTTGLERRNEKPPHLVKKCSCFTTPYKPNLERIKTVRHLTIIS
jgi:hypothetical protein